MLPVEGSDYLLRPCVFTTQTILEKSPPFWLLRLSPVDPRGKSQENLPLHDFFSLVSVRKEVHARFAKFLKIIENYRREAFRSFNLVPCTLCGF